MLPENLPQEWRQRSREMEQLGATPQAKTLEWCANQLDECLSNAQDTLLNLKEASRVSEYSSDHLGRLVKEGKIPNYGRAGAPRVRQADLPRKALRKEGPTLEFPPRGKCEVVRSIVNQ